MPYLNISLFLVLGTLAILVASVPTSVLIRDSQLNSNLKAKRSTTPEINPPMNVSPSDNEPQETKKSVELPLQGFEQLKKTSPKKRGINNPLQYDGRNSEPFSLPGLFHAPVDFQQDRFDDLPMSNYNNRLFENYNRPSYLDYPSSYKYYGDRKKRSNKLNIPLKRDSLTPADMLALVALVEAGERSRHADLDENEEENEFVKSNGNLYPTSYEIQNGNDENEYGFEPSLVDYYGIPYNLDSLPKYELPNKLSNNRFHDKRFMVSKKKRSIPQMNH